MQLLCLGSKRTPLLLKTNTFNLYIFANLFLHSSFIPLIYKKDFRPSIFHYTIHCGLKYNFLIIASPSLEDNNFNKKLRSLKIALCKGCSTKNLVTNDVFQQKYRWSFQKQTFLSLCFPLPTETCRPTKCFF